MIWCVEEDSQSSSPLFYLRVGRGDNLLVRAEDLHVFGKDEVEEQGEDGADAVRGGEEDEDAVANTLLAGGAIILGAEGTGAGPERGPTR